MNLEMIKTVYKQMISWISWILLIIFKNPDTEFFTPLIILRNNFCFWGSLSSVLSLSD